MRTVLHGRSATMRIALLFAACGMLAVSAAELDSLKTEEGADYLPPSAVKWICPDEPFPDGIGKMRCYRHEFETKPGLVKATARWWVDDTGHVFVDGKKMPYSAKSTDRAVDLTALLSKPGRHVVAAEGVNMAGSGGVCLSIDLAYDGGRHESVHTDESWRYTAAAELTWTSVGFDDSGWKAAKVHGDLSSAPWCAIADMSQLATHDERLRRAQVHAAREERASRALAVLAREEKPVCKIVYENGKPYFDIGGRRFETTFYNCSEDWKDSNEHLRRQAAMFRDAGMHLYGVGIKTRRVWRKDGSIDFAVAEQILRSVLSVDPDARFFFCFDTMQPPQWWMDAHPDEMVQYASGAKPDPNAPRQYFNFAALSFASIPWRTAMADYIGRFVRHLESTPYAKRIFAYRPDYGVHHEWHYYGFAGNLPDCGPAMTAAFRAWLRRTYGGDVAALRRAWGDPAVTFETAVTPPKELRLRTSAGALRDPVKERAVIDYLRCHHEQVRDCLFSFNRAAKEACGGRALVGNYCGYFFGMPFPAEAYHLENDAILDDPCVDFQCSPYVYGPASRAAGNVQYARCLLEGLRRRGKLAILEADNTTTILKTAHGHGKYTFSRADDLAILARDFVQTLCWGCGYWYFDFGHGWYDAPEFGEFFKKIYPIRKEITDCRSVSEVLVVGDYESVMLTNAESSRYNDERTTGLVNALGHSGVPFDSAGIADLSSGQLKDYKVYIFANLHLMTPEKERLVSDLRARGKTVVLPEKPLTAKDLRALFAANAVHIWNADADSAVYASAACVALHCATPGEKVISLPYRAHVEMLYPERREIAVDTDRILFTPAGTGMSTTLFRVRQNARNE